jgi:hypothetical protein
MFYLLLRKAQAKSLVSLEVPQSLMAPLSYSKFINLLSNGSFLLLLYFVWGALASIYVKEIKKICLRKPVKIPCKPKRMEKVTF